MAQPTPRMAAMALKSSSQCPANSGLVPFAFPLLAIFSSSAPSSLTFLTYPS
jgi:hypothetical protein